MHLPTVIILSVAVSFLTCSDPNLRVDPSAETPSDVVRRYVSVAHAGEFDKVQPLVNSSHTRKPTNRMSTNTITETKKVESNSEITLGVTVVPDEEVLANATSEWVIDFAKSIHDEKLSIKSIRSESVKDTEGRVEIVLGNNRKIHTLGWVFLLRKVDGQWRIYNITTPGELLERSQ